MKKHYIVYKTTNQLTSQYYIGVHGQVEDDLYLGSGIRLKNNIKFHGKENFSRVTLKIFQNENDAFNEEIRILKSQLQDSLCLNISKGGDGGANFTGKLSPEAQERKALRLQKFWDAKPKAFCAICEREFSPKRSTQSFCSKSCSIKSQKDHSNLKPLSLETKKKISNASIGNQKGLDKPQGGLIASHNRWHVSRGQYSKTCTLCNPSFDYRKVIQHCLNCGKKQKVSVNLGRKFCSPLCASTAFSGLTKAEFHRIFSAPKISEIPPVL